jgi:excisionase family DNA binding protein
MGSRESLGTTTCPQERVEAKGRPAMNQSSLEDGPTTAIIASEFPLTVKEAAKYLGVSSQTVYLWVERKQIPHLRVMGRNIRFLKSDLDSFRASFRQEMENA